MKRKPIEEKTRAELIEHLYTHLRTGHNFGSIRRDLAAEQHAARESLKYIYVTRHTVLGRLKQLKGEVFEQTFGDLEGYTRGDILEIIKAMRRPSVQAVEIYAPF